MSFKTSVLIWFSRSLWYSLTPSPSPTERGVPNGVRLLCETEEHGFWRQSNRRTNWFSNKQMILRHNDRKTYFLMTYHPSLMDFVSLPHIVCYYRLMFPHFVFKNMLLKNMSFCHCVYKIYYRFFAFYVLKNYVIVI